MLHQRAASNNEAGRLPIGTPARIGETTFHDIVSRINRQIYRIFVHRPPGEPPATGWPVLYMTDGNACIATAVDAMRVQSPYPTGTNVQPGVIVAIGYPVDGPYDSFRRSWDLCAPPGKTYPPFHEGGPEVRTGGGGEFLAFIEKQLKPAIEAELPIDRSRQALFGHSFGGMFVLYALFTRPSAFTTWIAASPSIYWDDRMIDGFYPAFAAKPDTRPVARLLLSVGEYETDKLAPFQVGAEDAEKRLAEKKVTLLDTYAIEMAERINKLPGKPVSASFELYSGETHMSMLPVAVNRGVQAAFAIR
jgi:predicted alpha/beta superfamily hydrolase